MPIYTKALCFLLVPAILMSILAVPSMRGGKKSKEADTQRGDAWATFQVEGASFTTPAGFTVHDPFTTATPHHDLYWSMSWPAKDTQLALVASETAPFQVFLHRGRGDLLTSIANEAIDYYEGNVMVELDPVSTWTTADGVSVQWRRVRYRPGLVASRDSTFVLGHGVRGDTGFLVNAGAHTADFDLELVRRLVESVRLGG